MNIEKFLKSRTKKIQKYLVDKDLDCLLVTNPVHLFYLSNYKNSDAYIFITSTKAYYLTDARYFEEAKNNIEDLGLVLVKGENFLKNFIGKIKVQNIGYEANHLTVSKLDLLKKKLEHISLIKTKNVIENIRHIKDEYEISQIRKAIKISKSVFSEIENNFFKFKTENEISDFYEIRIKAKGASGVSFKSIIANGKGSSIPHYTTGNKKINLKEITLIDIGCKYNNYCSDMTRMRLPKNCNKEILDALEIVKKAKEIAIKEIKPGVKVSSVSKKVRDFLKSNKIENKFIHSLGHSVGLNVHDGLVISKKSKTVFKEGMIFTIEPGIYFEGKFGIRLEDMVLVTKCGCKQIS